MRSRQAYHLHKFCMSLMQAENREAFRADERAYLDRFRMSEEQKQAVLERDFTKLIDLGGNIYFLVKLSNTDGWSAQQAVGSMTGMTPDEYAAMMRAGGRSIEGNRSITRARTDGADHGGHRHQPRPRDRRRVRSGPHAGAVLEAGVRRLRMGQGVPGGTKSPTSSSCATTTMPAR